MAQYELPIGAQVLEWHKEMDEYRARLWTGVYSTGIAYCDKANNLRQLAFLPFDTLQLDWWPDKMAVAPHFRALIQLDAEKIQARRGEQYEISSCGQTVTLGQ